MREKIIKALQDVTGANEIHLESPENVEFGDYSSNVALQGNGLKVKGKSPREKAENIITKLNEGRTLANVVDKIEVAGPGFINFWLKKDALIDNLIQIITVRDKFGSSNLGNGKTVVIDYSSPNIAKRFGIGHLRSTLIGAALYNLYKFLGYQVIGDNHLGDWGTQFGKLLYMIKTRNPKELSIETLERLYVEFHKSADSDPSLKEKAREWFKKLEEGDPEAREIWQKCVDVSMNEFSRIYEMLGVKIDFAFGESYYETEMRQMLADPAVKKYLTRGEDGAAIIDLTEFGIKTPLMFLKKDGATTYAARDLAAIKFRVRKWDPSIIIYEVGAEQSLHFKQVFAAARLLGLVRDEVELVHTAHGLYLAPDGKKFSTRRGKTIRLEDVLLEAIEKAKKLGNGNEELAQKVGIGAIKYFDLMHSVRSDIVFDWNKMMNLEGNSGPYLQYTVARTNSVLARSTFRGLSSEGEYSNLNSLNSEELLILRVLIKFPEVVELAARSYAPNLLCNYLYDLASKFNGFYSRYRILDADGKRANNSLVSNDKNKTGRLAQENFRLALTFGVGQVLRNGLKLLGIDSPERM